MKKFLPLLLALPLTLPVHAQDGVIVAPVPRPGHTPTRMSGIRFTLLQNDKPMAVFEFPDAVDQKVKITTSATSTSIYNDKEQTATLKGDVKVALTSGDKTVFSFSATDVVLKVEFPHAVADAAQK